MRKEQPASHEIRNIRLTLSHLIFYVCFTAAYKRRSQTLLGILLYDPSFSVFKCFNPAPEKKKIQPICLDWQRRYSVWTFLPRKYREQWTFIYERQGDQNNWFMLKKKLLQIIVAFAWNQSEKNPSWNHKGWKDSCYSILLKKPTKQTTKITSIVFTASLLNRAGGKLRRLTLRV